MKIFVVTGGNSGIGKACVELLRAQDHKVIVVDLANADINADLSTVEGRKDVIEQLQSLCPSGIDGFIPCAGLGPDASSKSLIAKVNFFAVTVLTAGVMPMLNDGAKVVLISSNSAYLTTYNTALKTAFDEGDEERAATLAEQLEGQDVYGASKYCLLTWMRKQTSEFASRKININAVAPGITRTAMTDKVFKNEQYGQAMQDFAAMVPLGYTAEPQDIANVIMFLVSDAAKYCMGVALVVDGGIDAMLRPEIKI